MTPDELLARLDAVRPRGAGCRAALDPLQYDREREDAAAMLGVRVSTLDKEVAARRPGASRDAQGRAIAAGPVGE